MQRNGAILKVLGSQRVAKTDAYAAIAEDTVAWPAEQDATCTFQ